MRLTLRYKCLNKVRRKVVTRRTIEPGLTRTNLMALRPRGNFTLGWSTMTPFSSKKKKNKWQFAARNIGTYPGQIHLERSVSTVLPLWIFAFSTNHILIIWYFADRASQYIYLNINQLDALNFIISLFHASTCFEHMCSSSGGPKLYYTVSGIITPIGGRPMHISNNLVFGTRILKGTFGLRKKEKGGGGWRKFYVDWV